MEFSKESRFMNLEQLSCLLAPSTKLATLVVNGTRAVHQKPKTDPLAKPTWADPKTGRPNIGDGRWVLATKN